MEFWLDRLCGAVPTQLPIAIKDSLKQPLCDAERQLKLSGSPDRLPTSIGSEANVKIDTIVLSAWALLLARYSCTADVLFGSNMYSPIGRSEEILPIRIKIENDRELLAWLQELESLSTGGELPTLAHICEEMQVRAIDLLTSVLVFTRSGEDNLEPINYPLVLKVVTGERLGLKLAYDSQRFEVAAIDRMLGHLQTLIEGMVANLHQTLAEVPMLTAVERDRLLIEWNDTQVDYPRDKTIHQVFAEQVKRTPEAIAVILPALDGTPDLSLTYRQLDDRSNNLAIALQELGVGTETPVAMCLERSIESIVAILGILKAGGVYVPLDPAYPPERLALMLADIPSPVLLTQSHLVVGEASRNENRLPSHTGRVVCLDVEMPQPRFSFREASPTRGELSGSVNASNLAYINFTSGSTGRPKGVAIPHRAVLRLVLGSQFTTLDSTRTLLQLAPTSFDAATLEIWGALLHGGRCILFPGNGIPDMRVLGTVIRNYQVTTLWLTAALFNTIVAEAPETLKGVSEILTGGEALSPTHIRQAQSQLVGTQLINGYGPTESTTFTCCYRIPNPIDPQATSISIGRPIANTQVYILDATLQPVPIGIPGELYIGGDGLARGYIDRPELTAERFVAHPFSEDPNARLYKTGDLVRYLADGKIEFMGRSDDQVKIRGYRIELGEIETKLSQHQTVREAIVIVRSARLVAYVTAAANQSPQPNELKAALQAQLPEYMVPNAIVVLAKMPLTANGKADRRALPDLQLAIDPNFVAPNTATERTIAEIWGDVLSLERVGIESNFFDLGGTSLLGLQMVTRVQKQLNADFRAVKLYQYPTIRTLARFLVGTSVQENRTDTHSLPTASRERSDADSTRTDVAIIGMVGRFPGANDVAEFWHNLCEGIDTNSWFTDAQIDPSIDPELRADPHYVRARGILADADMFDAAFFGITPREAEIMDPQARIFLELAHQALETVGYTPDRYPGEIGLYAGSGQNTYFEKHICTRSEIVDRLGEFQTMLANEKDFLTTRTSYKLGLTGPSLSINTACSTSLVAIIQAVRSLSDRHCDMALAGGVSITTPQNRGYIYQEGGMLSPDGRCRPFDAHAGGTLFNSGAGIVVLKRVEAALADGDRIYAVIKGVGLNNDGADKVSFTAPSVNGQAAAIAMAHADCGCDPKTISYVETHGTATAMGDPIEIEALTLAFQQPADAKPFCAIGSLEGNIGHIVAAAGVAGVIKTALALDRQQLPPSINFGSPNPAIDFANSPFFVNTQLTPWQPGATPLRAGVSSFGVGGTNAHIILEQAPTVPPSSKSRPCQLLVLSAKTAPDLDKATANLQAYLAQTTENLADIAFTLQQGRTSFNYRRTIVCRDAAEAVAILETQDVKGTATRHTEFRNPDVVFMFPGQGSQYVNMGANLYQTEPVFRDAVDLCAEILMPLLGRDLRTILYPSDTDREAATMLQGSGSANELRQTQFTQPAIFTVEYALAQLWQSWGIKPAAAIGHSIGEFVAACLAGVFSLADGLKLIATRGRMMGDLPAGAMLSVLLPAAEVAEYLSGELALAAINGPSLCVISGPTELIAALQHQLEAKEIVCKPLHTSHAFHSPMMEPILPAFADLAKTIELSPPQIPFVSSVTGTWITDTQATDYLYWTNHLRATVRFAEGIQTLWQVPARVLLEVGPRTTAATLARQQITDRHRQVAISSLGSSAEDNAEWTSIIHAIGQLWRAGVEIDWNAFYHNEYRHRTPLPTYPFDRQRYWIDPKPFIPKAIDPTSQLPPPTSQLLPPISPTLNSQLPRSQPVSNFLAARDDVEFRLTQIWETILGMRSIGITDDFFDLGGNSLVAVRLFAQIKAAFNKNLPLAILLQASTIQQLAIMIRQDESVDTWSSLVEIKKGGSKPPLFCIHGGGFNILVYRDFASRLDADRPVYGLQAQGLDGSGIRRSTLADIAADYIKEIRTLQPHGPYFLCGLSSGGKIALEIAQQLIGVGEETSFLGMFDSFAPGAMELLSPLPRFLSSLQYTGFYSIPQWIAARQPDTNVLTSLFSKLSTLIKDARRSPSISITGFEPEIATTQAIPQVEIDISIKNSIEQKMNYFSDYILEISPWSFLNPSNQFKAKNGRVPVETTELALSYSKVQKAYILQPYPGKITVFMATESPPGYSVSPNLGWDKIAKGGVETFKIPGHHTSIMVSPLLSEKVSACLKKASEERRGS